MQNSDQQIDNICEISCDIAGQYAAMKIDAVASENRFIRIAVVSLANNTQHIQVQVVVPVHNEKWTVAEEQVDASVEVYRSRITEQVRSLEVITPASLKKIANVFEELHTKHGAHIDGDGC